MIRLQSAANATVLVDSTSTEILAANDRRKFATITNSSNVGIWLAFGAAAEVGKGAYLAAGGGSYNITVDNLWVGVVNGITTSGDDKVAGVVEFQ